MVTCEEEPCSGSYKMETWTKVGRTRKRKKKLSLFSSLDVACSIEERRCLRYRGGTNMILACTVLV